MLPPDKHLRMTRQRRIILQELRKVKTHPSADEVYTLVRKHLPRISLGTVYRNLEILAQLGEIQKIEVSGCLKRFDGNMKDHYHIRCMACNRLDDVPENIHFEFNDQVEEATRFRISGHRLEFIGLCPECAEKQTARMMNRICSSQTLQRN